MIEEPSAHELLAREFESWQKRYMDEVRVPFIMSNQQVGEMAFESWERDFKDFLTLKVSSLHRVYRKRVQTKKVNWMQNSFNSTVDYLWQSQKGEAIEAFIDQAIKDARAGHITSKGTGVVATEKPRVKETIFIGHGRSQAWRDLKDFIQERLRLDTDEFNREATAGFTTIARLETMLNQASFAFLVMTAEDEHSDQKFHPRPNVIHELGLFQGRLGFNKAIILLEDGCEEFSNIHGLTHIPFPKGHIKAAFEEIRRVLEREGILK